ncbi:hypothetical protein [Pseudonocardia sp. GCM10023141]|uniref:hypothetical protein n=1 Tax=Pseudonocardia sp. GCM10023141 TaxID=3252653 RepID=UPI00361DF6C7
MNTIHQHRNREVRLIVGAFTVLGAVALIATLSPAVPLTAAALVGVVLAVRLTARKVRERREDIADALTATQWRAEHCRSAAHAGQEVS